MPPQEGVCIFFTVAVVVHMFVLFCMQKECVTEMVRIESADSPLSAMAGFKLLPEVQVYVRSHSSISSHVIMFLLSCAVEGGSRASHTRTRVPPQEGVCIFLLWL